MVERYQTSSSATMMGYDYHHQYGSSSLSGVFDAGYAPANYDGMMPNSSTVHQVFSIQSYFSFFLCSSFSCVPPHPPSFHSPTGSDQSEWWCTVQSLDE